MRICDVVGCGEPATTGRQETMDACDTHAQELRECLRVTAAAWSSHYAQVQATRTATIEHWKGGGTAKQLSVAEATPLLVVTPE